VRDDIYSREKLAITAEMLATGTGRVQDRLRDAYESGVGRLRPEDVHVGDDAVALLVVLAFGLPRAGEMGEDPGVAR